MAYDEELAHRLRELLAGEEGLSEIAMFGGLAFLLHGNMSVAASGQGGLLVRVDPAAGELLLTRPRVRAMEMRGRRMSGWLRVDAAAVESRRELTAWVRRGVEHARSLPPKG